MISKLIRNLKEPRALAIKLLARMSPWIASDRLYLSLRYRLFMGKRLELDNPRTFNEKLNWLKLNYHLPVYPHLVDKYEVKQIVADAVGEQYVITTLGVWDSADDIDFGALPDRFVLKCTHDSGGLVVCRDKSTLDTAAARRTLSACMSRNYFGQSREWGYKHVRPRIIAEQYMEDTATGALNDYKFFCFDGVPRVMYVGSDRATGVKFDFYDMDFRPIDVINGHPRSSRPIARPATFGQMRELAARLSQGHPFMRVDLYEVDGRVYFGEYTLYHFGGTIPFEPESFDYLLGSWLTLPPKNV